jgi:hypothetical protein
MRNIGLRFLVGQPQANSMTYRRQLSWSTSMRDLRRDRAAPSAVNALFAASMQRARALETRRLVQRRPLVVNCVFDRSALMSAAIAEAKVQRSRGSSASWRQLMASALRFTWSRAKAQRAKEGQ